MPSNLDSNFNKRIENLQINTESNIVETFNNIGELVWHSQASKDVLEKLFKFYNKIKANNQLKLFWQGYQDSIIKIDDNKIIYGLIEYFLYLKTYEDIEANYIDTMHKRFLEVFLNNDNKNIQYDIFSYLINYDDYRQELFKSIENNRDRYKSIIPTYERIQDVDNFFTYFKNIYKEWVKSKQDGYIQLVLTELNKENNNLVYISDKLRDYHDEKNEQLLIEFFLRVLELSKQGKCKNGIELVLTIYQRENILRTMIKYNDNFAKDIENASLLVDDRHISDLALSICKKIDYIEIAASYEHELLLEEISKNSINIIDIYRRKNILNKSDEQKLAARQDVILEERDLYTLNDIYRKAKKSRKRIIDEIKKGFSYTAKEIRMLSKLNDLNDNMVEALGNLGIQFYSINFQNSNFTGCLFDFPNLRRAAIVVNENLSLGRKNFTIAHEIGHLVSNEKDMIQFCDDNMYISYTYGKNEKKFDKFASEFLLPEETINRIIGYRDLNLNKVVDVAKKLNTSIEATSNRCVTISSERYVSAIYQDGRLDYASYTDEYIGELLDFEIKQYLDESTEAHNIMNNISKIEHSYISKIFYEDIDLWFDNCSYDYVVKSQVFIQHIPSKRIIVLLQLPNKELFQ